MARNISGRKGAGRKAGSSAGDGGSSFRPTRDDILAYIRDNPDRAGKRRIAEMVLPKSSSLADLDPDQLRTALGLRPEALLTDDNLEDHPDKIPAAPVLEAS